MPNRLQISGCTLFSCIACEFSLENFSYIQWLSFGVFRFQHFIFFLNLGTANAVVVCRLWKRLPCQYLIMVEWGIEFMAKHQNKHEWSISQAKWKNTNQCKLLVVVLILNLLFLFWHNMIQIRSGWLPRIIGIKRETGAKLHGIWS